MLTHKHRGKCFNRSPLSPTHTLRSCNGAGRTFQVVTLVLILVFARTFSENAVLSVLILALVFSALRIYAVWERNIILSLLILALDLVPFGMNLVRIPPYLHFQPFFDGDAVALLCIVFLCDRRTLQRMRWFGSAVHFFGLEVRPFPSCL